MERAGVESISPTGERAQRPHSRQDRTLSGVNDGSNTPRSPAAVALNSASKWKRKRTNLKKKKKNQENRSRRHIKPGRAPAVTGFNVQFFPLKDLFLAAQKPSAKFPCCCPFAEPFDIKRGINRAQSHQKTAGRREAPGSRLPALK